MTSRDTRDDSELGSAHATVQAERPARPDGGAHGRPTLGIAEWIRLGERRRVAEVLQGLRLLQVTDLRTGISWADSHRVGGVEWFEWLCSQVSQEVNLLPCLSYTPPSLGLIAKTSSPPRDLQAYADFVESCIVRLGEHFQWLELWNEPNSLSEWDWMLDPGWRLFAEMILRAAERARQYGKKTVLGGMSPIDPAWLRLMGEQGVLSLVDAVGVHAFPDASEPSNGGWAEPIGELQHVLAAYGSAAQLWVTETGFSTWRHDMNGQLRTFWHALEAPVDRVYWYSLHDLPEGFCPANGSQVAEREHHFGLRYADGRPKPLFHLWASGGAEAALRAAKRINPVRTVRSDRRPVVITGGAGFVGTNLAHRLLGDGRSVMIYDDLSRAGVERNLEWLQRMHGARLGAEVADVRDRHALRQALRQASQVYHLAAQVAVTKSLTDPLHDFEVNVQGTLNLLEELRALANPPSLVFTSTNKVYGDLQDLPLAADGSRYEPMDAHVAALGVSERRPLDFHSPYGCSKGAADQYVLDYARSYGLPAAVFRMSCIYGPHQFGTEDQGWVAHFLIRALHGQPITVFGDGKQVRDLLFVEDLVDALLLAQEHIDDLAGRPYNIGGGPANTTSLLELLHLIQELHGQRPEVEFAAWRSGDQRYYVSDTGRFGKLTGWRPSVGVREGVQRLYAWLEGEHVPMPEEAKACI